MRKRVNWEGQVVNGRMVVKYLGRIKRHSTYRVICFNCLDVTTTVHSNLKKGVGCLCKKKVDRLRKTLPLYSVYHSMKQRCYNQNNPKFYRYGARGIDVYAPWLESYEAWYYYVGNLPGAEDPDLSIDRVNNDIGYHSMNIRFATRSEQQYNREICNAKKRREK